MARTKKKLVRNPGLRRSQAVSTFGPGAIVELRRNSVMMGGQDFWSDESIEIHEPNLERILHVDKFWMPSTTGYSDLPALLFPEWLICPKCNRLAHLDYFTQGRPVETGKGILCPRCRKRAYPARLITACEHGHIDDFPWSTWVHWRGGKGNGSTSTGSTENTDNVDGEDSEAEVCRKPELYLRARGVTSGLSDLEVSCKRCGAAATLGGATNAESLGFLSCRGRRPWLGRNIASPCDSEVIPLQRGASNVYFPIQVSSISIPPWSEKLQTRLGRHWDTVRDVPESRHESLVKDLGLHKKLGTTVEEAVKAIRFRQMAERGTSTTLSERDLRFMECMALRQGTEKSESDSEFEAVETDIPAQFHRLLSRVMLVHRLREVRALKGFTRVSPPDPANRLEIEHARLAISPQSWLPAVEVRGEGIYLELNEVELAKWSGNKLVVARVSLLQQNYERMCNDKGWEVSRSITPRLVLIHSLSHLLIRHLSLESGYSSAALRERLYVFDSKDPASDGQSVAGLLIYTSTPDSEGSLGGLVRQGKAARLKDTLITALQDAAWCSSDPLCIESQGQGRDALNLAACHACLLASETSCEEFNALLDRGLLTGTLKHPEIGFFSSLVS